MKLADYFCTQNDRQNAGFRNPARYPKNPDFLGVNPPKNPAKIPSKNPPQI